MQTLQENCPILILKYTQPFEIETNLMMSIRYLPLSVSPRRVVLASLVMCHVLSHFSLWNHGFDEL